MSTGAPKTPKPTSPTKQAQADILVLNEQDRLAQAAQARQRELDEQKRVQELERWQTQLGSAYQSTMNYGNQRYGELGLPEDKYGIMSAYGNELDMRKSNIPEMGTVGAYFNNNVFDEVANRIRTTQRNQLTGQLNQFAGQDFERNTFSDTSDDAVLEAILGAQFTDARANLERQRDRGQINDDIFTRAILDLDNQRGSAMTKLQDIGGGVLGNYRKQLTDTAAGARNQIGAWDFTSDFNIDGTRNKITSLADQFRSRLEGDVRSAVGSQQLFDIPTLMARAKSTAGAVNTNRAPNGLAPTNTLDNDPRRTNSTQGAF